MARVGLTDKQLLFNLVLGSLSFGHIGFSTSQTSAAFSLIKVRPIPIIFSEHPIPVNFPETDILAIGFFEGQVKEDLSTIDKVLPLGLSDEKSETENNTGVNSNEGTKKEK